MEYFPKLNCCNALKLLFVFIWCLLLNIDAAPQKFNPSALDSIVQAQYATTTKAKNNLLGSSFALSRSFGNDKAIFLVGYNEQLKVPEYESLHNNQARTTTGVEYIQSPNGLNLSLQGQGVEVGVWDGGQVLESHIEFNGRVKNRDFTTYSNHATHVAGTVGASGINPEVKGMAPAADIFAYFAFEDDLGPMALEASEGLVLSNHSYGLILGWSYNTENNSWEWFGGSNQEDLRFGHYSSNSRSVDAIAYNAPHYTIVKSSGNDRNDVGDGTRPSDGPYITIGPFASAKNVITVGAINGFETYVEPSSAVMSDFSSWGPTRDGRIKPELVADGVGLLSTGSANDEDYTVLSGTSMSTPNVTGTLAIVQQYHQELYGSYLTAAELKALAVHTARECGSNEGPDAQFGFGVLNGIDAIDVIQNQNDRDTVIVSHVIADQQQYELDFFSDGNKPITATIAWTDVPGEVYELGSSQSVLVNDMDIKIIYLGDSTVFYPYRLNATNYLMAEKGINSLDNLEKVFIKNPKPGQYKVIVDHKGSLEKMQQTVALVLTGSRFIDDEHYYYVASNSPISESLAEVSGGEILTRGIEYPYSIVFDNRSWLESGENPYLNSDLTLNNFLYLADSSAEINLNGYTLFLEGRIVAPESKPRFKNGKVIISPKYSGNFGFNFHADSSVQVEFNSQNKHVFNSTIALSNLDIVAGNFQIRNQSIKVEKLWISDSVEIEIAECSLEINELLSLGQADANFKQNQWIFKNARLESDTISNFVDDEFSFFGNSTANMSFSTSKLSATGELTLTKSVTADSLVLTAPGRLLIGAGHEIEIRDALQINTNVSNSFMIGGPSAENRPTFKLNPRRKYCLANVEIRNLILESESIVNVDNEGSISSTEGFSQSLCEELVFADLAIESSCTNVATLISNTSSGNYDNSEIKVEGGLYALFKVDDQHHQVIFYDTVEYEVKVVLEDDLNEVSFSKKIIPDWNTVINFSVIENEAGLVASLQSESYKWLRNGILIPEETGRILRFPLEPGQYFCEISTESDCGIVASNIFMVGELTTNEDSIFRDLTIFPNPSQGQFISITGLEENDQLTFYSITGFKKLQVPLQNRMSNTWQADLSQLSAGVYLLAVKRKGLTKHLKFIKR